MRVVNEHMQTITGADLTKGRLLPVSVIRESAAPIDNEVKFAWSDEDYESAQLYIPNPVSSGVPTQQEKLMALIASLEVPDKPTDSVQPGYKWALKYTWGANSYAWESVKDENALGTAEKPIPWIEGSAVRHGYCYTDGENRYMALANGVPKNVTQTEFFKKIQEVLF